MKSFLISIFSGIITVASAHAFDSLQLLQQAAEKCVRHGIIPEISITIECSIADVAHEIAVPFGEPLCVVSDVYKKKQVVEQEAFLRNTTVNYMSQPSEHACAQSMSIQLRCYDLLTQKNSFSGEELLQKESYILHALLASVQTYFSEIMLIVAPTLNAYKRQYYNPLFPRIITWSYDHPQTILRIVQDREGVPVACELRGIDPLADPCLVSALFLELLLQGVCGALPLSESLGIKKIIAYDCPTTRALYQIAPVSLEEALQCAQEGVFLQNWLGQDCEWIYEKTQKELMLFSQAITDWEKSRYFSSDRYLCCY